jgi:hypothetical protein
VRRLGRWWSAQKTRALRLGIVAVNPRTEASTWVAFERRLRQLGYVDGQNLEIEFIPVNLQDDTIRAAVTRLVSSDVDIIATGGNEFIAQAALGRHQGDPNRDYCDRLRPSRAWLRR